MKIKRGQRGQVLVMLFGAMFLGGGLAASVLSSGAALKEMKEDIKALKLEDPRKDRALDIVARWKKTAKPAWKAQQETVDEIARLMANQYTTLNQLDEQFSIQGASMTDAEAQVIGLRDELRSVLSRSEWNRVFASD